MSDTTPRTIKQLAQEVLDVQNASNIVGVARTFAMSIAELRCSTNQLSIDVATHPITRAWLSKLMDLASAHDDEIWLGVWRDLRILADANDSVQPSGRSHRKKQPRELLLPLHPHCVLCQNEGRHEAARPHVLEGQE